MAEEGSGARMAMDRVSDTSFRGWCSLTRRTRNLTARRGATASTRHGPGGHGYATEAARCTSGRDAPLLLLRAAQRLESLDAVLARETYLDAWGAALVAGRLATSGGELAAVSAAARDALASAPASDPSALLLDGLCTMLLDTPGRAAPALRQAVAAFLDDAATDHWLRYGALISNAALALWDYEAWDASSATHVELARASSALAPLVTALNVRRVVAMYGRRLRDGQDPKEWPRMSPRR